MINNFLIKFFKVFLIRKSTFESKNKDLNRFKNLYNQLSQSIEQIQTLNVDNKVLNFVLENRRNSFSQFWQDLIAYGLLIENFNKEELENNFIEIGAWDGIKFSNTYYLEKYHNFKGVCIEPLHNAFKKLESNRTSINLNYFVSNTMDEKVYILNNGMMSKRILNPIESENIQNTDVITLNQVFEDYFYEKKDVDFISIDTEGTEMEVLKSLDFKKFRVKLFCIENNNKDIDTFLKGFGYEKLTKSLNAHDNWYIMRA